MSCSHPAQKPKSVILKQTNPQTVSVRKKLSNRCESTPKQKKRNCNHFRRDGTPHCAPTFPSGSRRPSWQTLEVAIHESTSRGLVPVFVLTHAIDPCHRGRHLSLPFVSASCHQTNSRFFSISNMLTHFLCSPCSLPTPGPTILRPRIGVPHLPSLRRGVLLLFSCEFLQDHYGFPDVLLPHLPRSLPYSCSNLLQKNGISCSRSTSSRFSASDLLIVLPLLLELWFCTFSLSSSIRSFVDVGWCSFQR